MEKTTAKLKTDYTPAVLDEASKLLLKAADVIEQGGWCQGTINTPEGRHCLVGAIHYANFGRDPDLSERAWNYLSETAFARVKDSIEDDNGLEGSRVALWNDHPARTKKEVVAKLRAVALGG